MNQHKVDPVITILDAALETIFSKKISGARLRQIAQKAGMSQGNLHYYFASKNELYKALLDHLLVLFVEERRSILNDQQITPQEKLKVFFDQQIALIKRQKEVVTFFDFWVQGTADSEIHKKITQLYAKWRADVGLVIQEGVANKVFSPESQTVVPAILASLMDGASLQFLMDESSLNVEEYFEVCYDMVLNTISIS